MKTLLILVFALISNQVFAQNAKYELFNAPFFKDGGTLFFAIEVSSGQIYYQRDYGNAAGKWMPFGSPIPRSEKHEFTFKLYNKNQGTPESDPDLTFIALDKFNGQIYFITDSQKAEWKSFGYPIQLEASPTFTFDMRSETTQGITYFALHEKSGQLYYMPDYGLDAGIWKKYGSEITPESK